MDMKEDFINLKVRTCSSYSKYYMYMDVVRTYSSYSICTWR